ncbi:gliding motility lipoprotein GldH [Ancylomarina longa]|uniref:Gliding motility lipoprotein GldH n=1 Tax=Ancylomarina longa TaxID=2487017 RepID=A0A434AU64_9BACT|nr:gliding motility lipoprotein GldH [Ancylomarina longa]RUT77998.1 gliding motility lipoprotein GldH [Ancylomarina longa]
MKKLIWAFFLILIGLGVTSCDFNRVYEQYEDIPNYQWEQKNILRFEVNIKDTIQANNIFLNIRNTGSYEYSNIWVFVKKITPDGKTENKKIELQLADEKGKWYGSGFGDIFDLQVPFQQNVIFPHSGKYVFEITQGMWPQKLNGVVNVGIRIEKLNHKITDSNRGKK